MVLKKCHRCHKEFTTTQHYTRHLLRKYPCKILDNNQNMTREDTLKRY